MASINQIHLMRLVLAIHDKGNLTAAAEALNTSLPTVVRQLANLEDHLGVVLFDRTTRKNHVTEEGAIYIESARNILREMDELELILSNRHDDIQHPEHRASGNITITAPLMFGRMHVLPIVNAFMANHQHITANLLLQDALTDLVESGIDVAFRVGEITMSDVVVVPVAKVDYVVCASPGYLNKNAPIHKPSDLKKARCIRNLALSKGNHWKFNVNGKTHNLNLETTFTSNNIDAAISHCVAGLGAGVFLSYQVEQLIKQGVLVEILRTFKQVSLPVSMIYPSSKRHLLRTKSFIYFAKKALSSQLKN